MLGFSVQIGHEGNTATLREPIDFQKKMFIMNFMRNNNKTDLYSMFYSAYPYRILFWL